MSSALLLLKLQPLLKNPAQNFAEIVKLLHTYRHLAEYEVARHWVCTAMMPSLVVFARSPDPRERRQAATGVRLVCTRTRAAELLRPLCKDIDNGVRARALHAARALHLDEVALPDNRFKLSQKPSSSALGGFNPTGWSYGLFASYATQQNRSAKTAAATRKTLLDKYALPALHNVVELSRWLHLDGPRALRRFLRPGVGTGSPYIQFEIPKASGEPRQITAPRMSLKRLQRRILDEILCKLPTHSACHGFVRGRSILSNAQLHKGAHLILKMDLRDFFPTIHYRRIKGLFLRIGYSAEVAAALAGLVTHRAKLADGTVLWPGVLPQGAPTSPALANLLCRRLDARLCGLAKRVGAVYTRYADDLSFSFTEVPQKGIGRIKWWISQICQQEGFVENTAKQKVLRKSNQLRVTGVVLNDGLHVPRRSRHNFRALLHNCRKDGLVAHARGKKDFRAYLLGYASYVKMVQPEFGIRLLKEVRALLRSDGERSP